MEHWERFCPGGLQFVYEDALFRPSTDSFLLGAFPRLRPGLRVCDLGCGTGLLSLLLLQRQRALSVAGVELLPQAADLARRAAAANGLEDALTVVQGDLREPLLPAGSFDLAVCNPPYYPAGDGACRRTGPGGPPGPRPPAPCRSCAGRRPGWCGGAGRSAWSTSRSGWRTCAAPCGRRAWSPSGCGWWAGPLTPPPPLLLLEARRGGRPGLAVEPPLALETPRDRRSWTPSTSEHRRNPNERNPLSGSHPHRQPGGFLPPGGGDPGGGGLHRRRGHPGVPEAAEPLRRQEAPGELSRAQPRHRRAGHPLPAAGGGVLRPGDGRRHPRRLRPWGGSGAPVRGGGGAGDGHPRLLRRDQRPGRQRPAHGTVRL